MTVPQDMNAYAVNQIQLDAAIFELDIGAATNARSYVRVMQRPATNSADLIDERFHVLDPLRIWWSHTLELR